jgi:two-component system phosphate regulon response regulator OmpR
MRNNRNVILIVDDDERFSSLLGEFLQKQNFEVLTATDPNEGLNLLGSNRIDLAIVDWMLPGLSGPDLITSVRKSNHATPILMVTANGEVGARSVALQAGASDFLPKPFRPKDLLRMVLRLLIKH